MRRDYYQRVFCISSLFLLFSCLALVSCSGSKKATVLTASGNRSLPPLPASSINIPVHIYMKSLFAALDSANAKEFTSDRWPDYVQSNCDFRYKYRFLRSPFTFSCVNNKVQISFRGYYQIAGSKTICAFNKQVAPWASGSCGFGQESLRRVDLTIGSDISIMPNHQVLTSTRLVSARPIDKCQVTLMATDVTQQILDSIRSSVNAYASAFDQFVQSMNNNEVLRQFRSGGSRVMPISTYGFMNLNPEEFRIGPLNYTQDTLKFSIGFKGRPELHSDSLSIVTNKALPPVSNTASIPGISTSINAVYEYSFFNKLLTDSLENKPLEIEGRTFVIRKIAVSGTDEGKLKVELSFTGNRTGVLRISGTPVLDTSNQVLSMPDIDFSIDTRDILVNMGKGLFRKKIIRQLKNQTVLDIAALVERNKSLIAGRLNQDVTEWMTISGTLNKLELKGLLASKDKIQLQFYINANLVLTGHPPLSSFLTK
ncbi:MAG TPA: DUF4403 family protein [Flavitalea sp.]|nr:DUF4403 family protein [Flavitalea sp.]